jgi:hypothetical protein
MTKSIIKDNLELRGEILLRHLYGRLHHQAERQTKPLCAMRLALSDLSRLYL